MVAAINSGTTADATGRRVLKQLIQLAMEHGVDLRAKHIAGKRNVVSDDLSRKKSAPSSADYKLASHWYHECLRRDGWGGDRPELPGKNAPGDAQGRARPRSSGGRGGGGWSSARCRTRPRWRG